MKARAEHAWMKWYMVAWFLYVDGEGFVAEIKHPSRIVTVIDDNHQLHSIIPLMTHLDLCSPRNEAQVEK